MPLSWSTREHVDALPVDVDRRDRAQREPFDVAIPGEGGREHGRHVREPRRPDLLVPIQAVAVAVVELPVEVAGERERTDEDRRARGDAEHRAERGCVDPAGREPHTEAGGERPRDARTARPDPTPFRRGARRGAGRPVHSATRVASARTAHAPGREHQPVDLRTGVEARVPGQREQHHRRHEHREAAREHDAGGRDREGAQRAPRRAAGGRPCPSARRVASSRRSA